MAKSGEMLTRAPWTLMWFVLIEIEGTLSN